MVYVRTFILKNKQKNRCFKLKKNQDNSIFLVDFYRALLSTKREFICRLRGIVDLIMESNAHIKCRKCRTIIMKISAANILDAHSTQFTSDLAQIKSDCPTITGRTGIFFNEDELESWIQDEIERSEWTKGKLKCHKCTANVGSFDFVSASRKCDCKQFNQPPIHFISSKIDLEYTKT